MATLILVLEAHATAHSTAPGARLQDGLQRPGGYDVSRRPRSIFTSERRCPAGQTPDFRANVGGRAVLHVPLGGISLAAPEGLATHCLTCEPAKT